MILYDPISIYEQVFVSSAFDIEFHLHIILVIIFIMKYISVRDDTNLVIIDLNLQIFVYLQEIITKQKISWHLNAIPENGS